ncbi:MAG: YXWGXW repeat-containing protein [Pseudomonadota bacterium]|nr:YXWGXW repeat-containing protein [Pseudomonadota bacterium]
MIASSLQALLLAGATVLSAGATLALPTAAQAQAYIHVQIGTPPPPPRREVVPVARPGYVWAPGHYQWAQNHYAWRRGHWVAARPGYAYVAPAWVAQGGRWVYQPARWDARPVRVQPPRPQWDNRGRPPAHARPGGRDHDRYGRYDRRPSDPYRR